MCQSCEQPDIMFGEHYLLWDGYGWHWCGCGWFYIVGTFGHGYQDEMWASFMNHLEHREREGVEEEADSMWELYDIYFEYGLAEDIHAGDRNYVTDPEFEVKIPEVFVDIVGYECAPAGPVMVRWAA